MRKKIKAYKFSLLMAAICSILTGVNYVVFKVAAVGRVNQGVSTRLFND